MDPAENYLSIPATYPVKMEVIESPGKYSKPFTLETIINTFSLPVKVRFAKERANFSYQYDASSYEMKELELQDTYKETYYLCNAIFPEGELNERVVVMPVYVDITVQVASGWTTRTEKEWIEYIGDMAKTAARLDYDIAAPNKNIAVYSPGQLNAGENIYEYIVPNSFLTFSLAEESPEAPFPGGNSSYTVPLKSGPGQNEYVKLVPKPESIKKSGKAAVSAISIGAILSTAAPIQLKRGEKRPLPTPHSPISPLPLSPKPVGSLPSGSKISTNPPVPDEKLATISPFQYTPSNVKVSADNPKAKVLHQNVASSNNPHPKALRTPMLQMSDIPSDVSCLTVEEVCDCMKLLNLGQFVDAARKLQIDGFLLKEFSAEDYQMDPNFKMSVTQSKMLQRFAQKGWRPRHS